MKKFFKILAMATVALFAVLSCKKENQEVALTGITLDQPTLNLQVGAEATLVVKFQPDNVTNKPAVSWESSSAAIATVADGKVKAVAPGEATITAKADKFSATCKVTVTAGEEPGPDYSAWDGDWGVIGDFNGWADDVEMTKGADGWYSAEVTIEGGTLEFKFRRDKAWGDYEFGIEGETELDKELALTPKKGNLKVPKAGVYKMMLKPTAALAKIVFMKDIAPAGPVALDGDPADWANLPAENVVSLTLPEGAAMTGLKSAKAYYDDKLYFLLEISDEAIADGKVRAHIYFDVDNTGALKQNWTDPVIDYMTEGKITDSGAYVAYSSTLYKWAGDAENPWKWEDSVWAPECDGAGKDHFYELSLGYAGIPGGLPVAFNFGLDLVNSSWATFGFLPSVADGTCKLARLVKKGEVDPNPPVEEPEFDYTPSAEYNDAANLWKAVADANAEKYFYRYGGNEGNDLPHLVKNQSTYRLYMENATGGRWDNQFFMHPDGMSIALEENKIYKLKMTFQSTETFNGFVKLTSFNPDAASGEGGALYEWPGYPDNIKMVAGQPYVLETELSGKSAANISFTMDFGGNPAGAYVFIKDIILVQTGEVSPHTPIEWDYTASEAYLASNNLWKAVDAANTLEWAYNPGWQPATTPVDVKFTNSTYEFTIPEAFDGEWMCQLWIHPTAELNLDPAKKYNFSLTYYSETGASPLFKLYKKGVDGDFCFSPRPAVAQYEVYQLEEKEFTPCAGPLCLLIDFFKATAGSKVYIKDITLTEVGAEPAAPKTIAELIAAIPESATGNNTAVEVDVEFTNPATVSYVNGMNYYIQDETAAILIYKDGLPLQAGYTIKGNLKVKAYWFNGIPEIVDFSGEPVIAPGTAPAPEEVTIAQLLADYSKYLLRLVQIKGVTVTDGIADGDRNGEIAQGEDKIAVYAQINNGGLVLNQGESGDFVTIPALYKTTKQVYLWQNDWFTPGGGTDYGGGIPDYDPIGGFEW